MSGRPSFGGAVHVTSRLVVPEPVTVTATGASGGSSTSATFTTTVICAVRPLPSSATTRMPSKFGRAMDAASKSKAILFRSCPVSASMLKCVAKGTSPRLYVGVSPSSSVAVTGSPMAVPAGAFSASSSSSMSSSNTGGLRLRHSTVELLSTAKSVNPIASLSSVSWMGLVPGTA